MLVILAVIIGRGYLPGVVVGLVLAVVLFAVNYGRIELVREVAFGETYHSNVDRPPAERVLLRTMGDKVQILRSTGSCSSARPTACSSGSESERRRTRRGSW